MVWRALGASVDFFHALAVLAWIGGIPLLFSKRTPRVRHLYAIYAVAFIVLYHGSRVFLGECFLTTLARALWRRAENDALGGASDEWFTVRVAEAVFDLSPSHAVVTIVAQILIFATAAGVLYPSVRRRVVRRASL